MGEIDVLTCREHRRRRRRIRAVRIEHHAGSKHPTDEAFLGDMEDFLSAGDVAPAVDPVDAQFARAAIDEAAVLLRSDGPRVKIAPCTSPSTCSGSTPP